ncbi:hypothetical protein CK203_015537 [Vitis vinifera]|uniref:Uncharacterized protein n=1 Tax=Vitis vinifera TaxID=29760 RepID=A0A438J5L2_VITVI|nr:hypothetical protein CK203_015537 [Vitis vinifera]
MVNQDLMMKQPAQETLFSSPAPLFMFDTGSLDLIGDGNGRTELFQEVAGLSSETWQLNQHQVEALTSSSILFSWHGYELFASIGREHREHGAHAVPSFLFWDQVEGHLGGEEIAPPSSNMGAVLSSYSTSL